jgi:hypothetical protein
MSMGSISARVGYRPCSAWNARYSLWDFTVWVVQIRFNPNFHRIFADPLGAALRVLRYCFSKFFVGPDFCPFQPLNYLGLNCRNYNPGQAEKALHGCDGTTLAHGSQRDP